MRQSLASCLLSCVSACAASAQPITVGENNTQINTNPENAREYIFKNIVPTGIAAAGLGPDPPILFIAGEFVPEATREYPGEMRSVSIAFDGPVAGERTKISNKARTNPLDWYPPTIAYYPRDIVTGEYVHPATFQWSSLQMTLAQAIQVAQQAGYPPPWRKVKLAYINDRNIFDEPGPPEIVWDLVNFAPRRRDVAVGSVSRRVKLLARTADLEEFENRNGTIVRDS